MPDETLEVFSAGDRVHVRVLRPASGGPRPLVLWLASDGCADADEVGAAHRAWGWCTLVAPDLPLCGRRASEKLSGPTFSAGHPLHAALSGDAARQLQSDLECVLARLSEPGLDAGRLGLVALGYGAQLAAGCPALPGLESAHIIDAHADPDAAWLARTGERLRKALP